eukprot:TRINITY_DN1551_c0_g1::TRINITY_DN1551_c0_g1_i1::g.28281::m.28281 TRINITY_DN1551_c0_g1::TRINITY_DN1551_c0_g1_i1::g.28281  ORF type:complete len:921 (-),score=275.94,sp/Q9XYS3/NOXA_DICDI/31.57/2e-67,NAD_binding_6/PF08030.7/1.1e-16,Ferric_reduct/PF01794.14/3.4e-14,FAD_binding_8/PF08022.7/2.2e-11,SH3_1/PF00018.23/8.6e-09,SH3_2/PF07653.12/3.7e-07,SH3_9/PF14604.1/3.8e-06,SH3_3/PF08239.6/0.12,TMEM107/PF14995.1/37,TMEM107/PF14995.1/39 TRINITY_DN1551_c0_g1_i1:183-2891(-)
MSQAGDAEDGLPTAIALFNRDRTPFPIGQLSKIQKDDIVTILEKNDNGWWMCRVDRTKEQGLVPSSCLRVGQNRRQSVRLSTAARKSIAFATAPPGLKTQEKKASLLPVVEERSAPSVGVVPAPPAPAPEAKETVTTSYENQVAFVPAEMWPRVKASLAALRFGMWSRQAALWNSYLVALVGLASFIDSFTTHKDDNDTLQLSVGLIAMVSAGVSYYYETRYSVGIEWYRSVVYLALGVVLSLPFDTNTSGVSTIFLCFVCFLATVGGEPPCKILAAQWAEEREREKQQNHDNESHLQWKFSSFKAFRLSFSAWWLHMRIQNKLGEYFFLGLYLLGNLIMFAQYAHEFDEAIAAHNEDVDRYEAGEIPAEADTDKYKISRWIPLARGCGQILNFNCAFVLFPVLRLFQRMLNATVWGFSLGKHIPLGKNIEFHILVALLVALATAGHLFAHLMNLTQAYDYMQVQTVVNVPLAWYTGILATVLMVFMYGASMQEIRRANFETFWFSHHMYYIFWFLMLLHGPRFWKWFLLAGALYAGERLTRQGSMGERIVEKVFGRPVKRVWVHDVEYLEPNVLKISLDNHLVGADQRKLFEYREGMYVKICCPYLSRYEYHPFTISSAPDDDYLTVHIKCGKPTSWTGKLRDYFMLFNPAHSPKVLMQSRNESGEMLPGRWQGPDGDHLLRVDGPYAAPCMHIRDYKVVMLVGAGIGLTPFSSALGSIIRQRWSHHGKSCEEGQCYCQPRACHFIWSCRIDDFAAFQWFVQMLAELKGLYQEYRGSRLPLVFETTLYITGQCSADQLDMVRHLVGLDAEHGAGKGEDAMPYPPHRCIQVRTGRPKFNQYFEDMRQRYKNNKIGVFCCGPMGRDLQECCEKYTTIKTKKLHGQEAGFEKETTIFNMHAEVF